jgi:hypothetical protein
MRMEFKFETKVRGPLFDGKGLTLLGNAVNDGIREMVQMGEERLAFKFRPQGSSNLMDDKSGIFKTVAAAGRNASTGHYRRSIQSKIRNLHAVIDDGNVVYGPWLEGISSRNLGRFPGYRQFRITQQYLQKEGPPVIKQHIDRFAKRMNA